MALERKKGSILTRLLAGIILPVLLIFVGSASLILGQLKGKITEVTTNELAARSEASANQISEFFTKNIEVTRQLAANYELEKLLKTATPGVRINQLPAFSDFMKTMLNVCELDPQTIAVSWIADVDSSQCLESSGWVSEEGEWDITGRSWFGEVTASKKTIVTEPYLNSSTGAYVSSVISPVYDSSTDELLGVAAIDISVDSLKTMMSNYKLGDTGFFLLLSKADTVIYHPLPEYIDKNVSEAGLSENMVAAFQNSQEGTYTYDSVGKLSRGYLSIAGESGWKVLTGLPDREFYSSYRSLKTVIVVIFGLGLLLLAAIIFLISSGIIRPLKRLTAAANSIADGDLDVQLSVTSRDETGQVAEALRKTVLRLKDYIAYIREISSTLEQVAGGNFNYELTLDYVGEFQKVKNSLEEVSSSLSETMHQIHVAAEQVASGSGQVASGAQALSQGTTEQASSIEELSATINEISAQISENAKNVQSANEISEKTSVEVEKGSSQMREMTAAIEEISNTSGEIGKIIKTIEDIAFQTNILALNASVEAARAGRAGKGFAVVASEVGNLAGKSAEAAKNTTSLIEGTIRAIENGTRVAEQTAESLRQIVEDVKNSSALMEKVASASAEQAEAVSQVTVGIDQIASVVQTNSATAEQSAAASEELSSQAQLMEQLLEKFTLKTEDRQ